MNILKTTEFTSFFGRTVRLPGSQFPSSGFDLGLSSESMQL